MAYYIGIDPSVTNTGVVILDEGADVVAVHNSRDTKVRSSGVRSYLEKSRDIVCFISEYADGCVLTYEDYSYGSTHKAFTLAEYGGVLKACLLGAAHDIEYAAPSEVKRFGAGKGTATKDQMVRTAEAESMHIAMLPSHIRTDDVCDAYFLAKLGWYRHNIERAPAVEKNRNLLRTRMEVANGFKGKAERFADIGVR